MELADVAVRLLDGLGEVKAELAGLGQRVESYSLAHAQRSAALESKVDNHERRITDLEKLAANRQVSESYAAGVVAGTTGLKRRQLALLSGVFAVTGSLAGAAPRLLELLS